MPRYAIVCTDSGLIPGVNGMLNALPYYGHEHNVELHKCQKQRGND